MAQKLGQNYLTDKAQVNKIINLILTKVKEHSNTNALEIGFGKCALTWPIAPNFKCLTAVDIDPTLYHQAKKIAATKNAKNINFVLEDGRNQLGTDCQVAFGNLPYCSAKHILFSLAKNNCLQQVFVMVQYEMMLKVLAKKGYFSYFVNLFFDLENHFKVNRKSFSPAPKVHGGFVYLKRKLNYEIEGFKKMNRLLRFLAFGRNKKLKNLGQSDLLAELNQAKDDVSLDFGELRANSVPNQLIRQIYLNQCGLY